MTPAKNNHPREIVLLVSQRLSPPCIVLCQTCRCPARPRVQQYGRHVLHLDPIAFPLPRISASRPHVHTTLAMFHASLPIQRPLRASAMPHASFPINGPVPTYNLYLVMRRYRTAVVARIWTEIDLLSQTRRGRFVLLRSGSPRSQRSLTLGRVEKASCARIPGSASSAATPSGYALPTITELMSDTPVEVSAFPLALLQNGPPTSPSAPDNAEPGDSEKYEDCGYRNSNFGA